MTAQTHRITLGYSSNAHPEKKYNGKEHKIDSTYVMKSAKAISIEHSLINNKIALLHDPPQYKRHDTAHRLFHAQN